MWLGNILEKKKAFTTCFKKTSRGKVKKTVTINRVSKCKSTRVQVYQVHNNNRKIETYAALVLEVTLSLSADSVSGLIRVGVVTYGVEIKIRPQDRGQRVLGDVGGHTRQGYRENYEEFLKKDIQK